MKQFFCIILFSLSLLKAQDSSVITLFPDEKYIPSFTASGTEHRISYAKQLNNNSFTGSLGGLFPAALVNYKGIKCIVSIGSTLYTTLKSAGIRYNVTNADFYVDVLFDFYLSDYSALRFGSGHTSHHLVDDGVAAIGAASVINYARDYYQLFYVHQVSVLRGFAYGGTYYSHSFLINSRRDGQFLLQLGADGGNITLWKPIVAYAAFDFKLRSEVTYGSTQSYQAGIRVMNEHFRSIRIAYTYRTGIDDRGQFYNQRNTQHSLGLYFDF